MISSSGSLNGSQSSLLSGSEVSLAETAGPGDLEAGPGDGDPGAGPAAGLCVPGLPPRLAPPPPEAF